jgi:hypothetical protein
MTLLSVPQAVFVAVGFRRVALSSPWADHAWRLAWAAPAGVYPGEAELRFDNLELRIYSDEAEDYLLNLTTPAPMLFVVWRMEDDRPNVISVTASYGEAARMLDSGEQVEGVPLADDLRGWIEDFARSHYQPPEKKVKTKRYASSRREMQP